MILENIKKVTLDEHMVIIELNNGKTITITSTYHDAYQNVNDFLFKLLVVT
jgi:hypothetical protein